MCLTLCLMYHLMWYVSYISYTWCVSHWIPSWISFFAARLPSPWQVAEELGQNGGMAAPRYLLVRLGTLAFGSFPLASWHCAGVQVSVSLQRLVLHQFIVPGRFLSATKSSWCSLLPDWTVGRSGKTSWTLRSIATRKVSLYRRKEWHETFWMLYKLHDHMLNNQFGFWIRQSPVWSFSAAV